MRDDDLAAHVADELRSERRLCREAKQRHWHDWRDDDVSWCALICARCGENMLDYAKRRPDLALLIEEITPAEVKRIESYD